MTGRQQLRLWKVARYPELDRDILGERLVVDHEHWYLMLGIDVQEFLAVVRSAFEIDDANFEIRASFKKSNVRYERTRNRRISRERAALSCFIISIGTARIGWNCSHRQMPTERALFSPLCASARCDGELAYTN